MDVIKEVERKIFPKKKIFIEGNRLREYNRVRMLHKKAKRQIVGSNRYAKTINRLNKAFKKAEVILTGK